MITVVHKYQTDKRGFCQLFIEVGRILNRRQQSPTFSFPRPLCVLGVSTTASQTGRQSDSTLIRL